MADIADLRRAHRRARHIELSALRAVVEDRQASITDRYAAAAELTSPRFPAVTRASAEDAMRVFRANGGCP